MTCHIIGCGTSGSTWNGEGFSIGVNDCWRFGNPTNHLVVVNSFGSEPARREIVQRSTPDVFWGHLSMWADRPDFRKLEMQSWKGNLSPGKVYYSNNSPFIAVTLAYKLGYRKIILWGVDFNDHKTIKDDLLKRTLKDFSELQAELIKNGASMYLGAKGSRLDLEVWK